MIRSMATPLKHSRRYRGVYNLLAGSAESAAAKSSSSSSSASSLHGRSKAGASSSSFQRWLPVLDTKPSVNHVTVVIFLEFFAWGLVTTVLPEAIKEAFGTSQMWLVLGLTQGVKGLLAFLSAPVLGALSDRYGRKAFLLLTVAATCAPLPLLLLGNLWPYSIMTAASGAGAVTFSIVFAYVSDVTDADDRNGAFGQVSATFAASLVVSPAIGSFIFSEYGATAVYMAAVICALADLAFIYFFVPESKTRTLGLSWVGGSVKAARSSSSSSSSSSKNNSSSSASRSGFGVSASSMAASTATTAGALGADGLEHVLRRNVDALGREQLEAGVKVEAQGPLLGAALLQHKVKQNQKLGQGQEVAAAAAAAAAEEEGLEEQQEQQQEEEGLEEEEEAEATTPFEWAAVSPFQSLRHAFHSRSMMQISIIVFFSYLPEAGEYQCLMLYLQNSIGFSPEELAGFIGLMGILSILAQTAVLTYLSERYSQKNTIIIGLVFGALQLGIFGIISDKGLIFFNAITAALGSLTYPAVSALVSQAAGPRQQGVVQGIVTGFRGLCTGLGPALFGILFQMADVSLEEGQAPPETYFPGAPFLVGSGSVLVALFVMMGLPEVERLDLQLGDDTGNSRANNNNNNNNINNIGSMSGLRAVGSGGSIGINGVGNGGVGKGGVVGGGKVSTTNLAMAV